VNFPRISEKTFATAGEFRGHEPRDFAETPIGSLKGSAKLATSQYVPRSEWQSWIEQKTAEKSWPSDLCDAGGLPVYGQGSTNLCWCNAPARTIQIARLCAGQSAPAMSAAFLAVQLNGYVNRGGSGTRSMHFAATGGVCAQDVWPNTAWDDSFRASPRASSFNTPAALENAAHHLVSQFLDHDPQDIEAIVSLLLRSNIPTSVGVPYWPGGGHEVSITFLRWDNGVRLGFDNSWDTSWGTNGRAILDGRCLIFDEATSPVVVAPDAI
jgi:hypothetical protein